MISITISKDCINKCIFMLFDVSNTKTYLNIYLTLNYKKKNLILLYY